ncbi:Sua5/YciO/YrdC/YwlC family protein, partial [Candidatus Babeliales bacterium]|nr:Sua5/YciO/YrdC/YwlC family protein [Candidatus Babeliales bacterium]
TFKSYKKLNNIKTKRDNKPYLILIDSIQKLKKFVSNKNLSNKNIINLINNCWPGPVTIIFKAKKNLPKYLKSEQNTIAIRCPNNKNLQKLLSSFDGLFSTSANISNQPIPTIIENIDPEILKKIDYLVVDIKKSLPQTLPSTIIDLSNEKEIKVLRKGAFPIGKLEEYYGTKFKKSGE